MTQIELCPSCWVKVEPLLGKAALDERAHLLMIARKLTVCRNRKCRTAAATLRVKATGEGFASDLGDALQELGRWVR